MKEISTPERDALTGKIIGGALNVSNGLGCGFLESVYKNALYEELISVGIHVQKESSFEVFYKEKRVGTYVADLAVEGRVIVELKAVSGLMSVHHAQLLNYLRASRIAVGLLINFGVPRLEWKRLVL
jgi:GxxExxY protein